jgi:hypothetical protein
MDILVTLCNAENKIQHWEMELTSFFFVEFEINIIKNIVQLLNKSLTPRPSLFLSCLLF